MSQGVNAPRVERLAYDDPTVFAKCLPCDKRGTGAVQGTYYGMAFSGFRWKRGPKCENCRTPLTEIYRVATDE